MPAASPRRWPRRRWSAPGSRPTRCGRRRPGRTWCMPGRSRVGFLPIAHSIPESSALVIDTPAGRILHSGDFKADPTPLVGEPFDPEALRALGDAGREGAGLRLDQRLQPARRAVGGDADRADRAADAGGRGAGRRHHLRLERRAAEDARRGRAGRRAAGRGARAGDEHHAEDRACRRGARRLSRRRSTRSTSTTCRGGTCWCSPPAARASGAPPRRSWRRASYMGLELRPGDTFLFSSKTIPGNEVAVARILNQLSEKGVTGHRRQRRATTTSRATPTGPTS